MTGVSTYTEAVAEEVLDWLRAGKPLAEWARLPGKPNRDTIYEWQKKHPEFALAFVDAREEGFDAIAHRLRKTARGKTEAEGGDSSGQVDRDKLIIDTDLKLLAKWDKRYGDRLQLSGDPEQPLSGVSDADLDARIAQLLSKGKNDGV